VSQVLRRRAPMHLAGTIIPELLNESSFFIGRAGNSLHRCYGFFFEPSQF
jgi:hypothetical protein